MEENVNKVEEQVVDTPATTNEGEQETPTEAIKTFTQEQVNEFVRERVNRSHANTLKHYGVDSYDELDELVNNSRKYKDQFDSLSIKNNDLFKENLYLKNNINPERYEDIDVYLKGLGVDLSEETFVGLLEKHPEWIKKPEISVKSLGIERHDEPVETEENMMKRIFGV